MEPMIECCCGIDVHQKQIVCCILSGPLDTNRPKKFFQIFGTRTADLRAALEWIESFQVTDVFMESTGQYWIPVFNIFSQGNFNQILANPQRIKGIPNRKTDMRDAEWIAQLGRCGLIPNSYIPNEDVLQLRYLTRRKLAYSHKRAQVKNEVHNILQRANIKLTSYLSDIFSKTGQALLTLFINGEVIQLDNVISCIHGKVKARPEELLLAMEGKLTKTDRYLLSNSLEEYRLYTKKITEMEQYIQQ
ncbi:transposase, partial [Aerococcaceae bacterium zg-ZJ1578]|uniref:IS110 family transposase n=1 Tax=Aerococcaceae bacterium zg-252 TaxID=2796928 RepID=UPI001A234396|nr:transposase [Aerococcaceae bacterium zg-1578]